MAKTYAADDRNCAQYQWYRGNVDDDKRIRVEWKSCGVGFDEDENVGHTNN